MLINTSLFAPNLDLVSDGVSLMLLNELALLVGVLLLFKAGCLWVVLFEIVPAPFFVIENSFGLLADFEVYAVVFLSPVLFESLELLLDP